MSSQRNKLFSHPSEFNEHFQSLDCSSKMIIWEEKINSDSLLQNLKQLLTKIKAENILSSNISSLRSLVNKLLCHLKKQDEHGYFSNNLTSEDTQDRKKHSLYLNSSPVFRM